MDKRTIYSSYKVRKDTLRLLRDMKTAFEACNDSEEATNDEFIKGLVEAALKGNPTLKKVYEKVVANKESLRNVAKQRNEQ